jgi:hypothetical protein
MALTCGTKLEPHEIVAPLGAGGTGDLYRASDTMEIALATVQSDWTAARACLHREMSGRSGL